jgi:hypothetical protein
MVTYDIGGGKWPSAINVRIPAEPQAAPRVPARHAPPTYMQYMGFEQNGGTRAYRFRRVVRGEETREFVVRAELALFFKHRIGFQEGPALSLRLLSEGADCATPVEWPPAQSLTDGDMLAHVARRAVGRKTHGTKRNPSS